MKLKYPTKVAGTLYPKGYNVRIATLEEVRVIWPMIQFKQGVQQVAVWFDGLEYPTIVSRNGLEHGD